MTRYRRGIPSDHLVIGQPYVIRTLPAAQERIQNGARVLFFGDEHKYRAGHNVVAGLMPAMATGGVRHLALELPIQMTPYLAELQTEIRLKGLNNEQIYQRLNTEITRIAKELNLQDALQGLDKDKLMKALKAYDKVTGGDDRIRDFATLIKSATENGISVVGIDPRHDPKFLRTFFEQAIKDGRLSNLDSLTGTVSLLRSLDAEAAKQIQGMLERISPDERIAVMYGAMHACTGASITSIAETLRKEGIGVTNISVVSPQGQKVDLPAGTCPEGASFVINASTLQRELTPQKSGAPAAPMSGR